MKIIIDDAIPYIEGRILDDVEIVRLPGKKILPKDVRNADALIVRTRTKCDESLLKDSKVKLVATATIGTDHIDIPWCEANGIIVKSAPGCNAPGVAQYVLTALLESGFNSSSGILGIIGYGHVGSTVAKWAAAMGIKTLISDAPRLAEGFMDTEYLSMEEVLKKSDAVTIHVPFTTEGPYTTKNLIGDKEIKMMKPDAILVNTSRGGIVDEESLKERLKKKKIEDENLREGFKAVIDVWMHEPDIDPELSHLAFIATPHIAGYSEEGKRRATAMVLSALNQTLGIGIDIEGLTPPAMIIPNNPVKVENKLRNSYSPTVDSSSLKADISSFEKLRNTYSYRHEPFLS